MDHQVQYDKIIKHYQELNLKRKEYGLGELAEHHIKPKALSGSNNKSNLVMLTNKAHIIAHHLLAKIHGGSMWAAYWRMIHVSPDVKITAKVYAQVKREQGQLISDLMKGNTNSLGIKPSSETKAKLSNAGLGNTNSLGYKHPPEFSIIMSLVTKGKNNPRYDHTVYRFIHRDGHIFEGTRHDFQIKHNLICSGVSRLMTGHNKTVKGWSLGTAYSSS